MPSTYTSGLRLIDQATGENATTWGELTDLNMQMIDDAITGQVCVDMTGASSYSLQADNGLIDEARNSLIRIAGVPASATSIIVPESEKIYAVHATHTSVSGGITVRTNGGTGVAFNTGSVGFVYCDGSDVISLIEETGLLPENNLSDLEDVSVARDNLELQPDGTTIKSSGGVLSVELSSLLNAFWPIGSLYSNRTDGTNPGTLMGFGTWVSAGTGRVPVGVGTGVDANGVSVVFAAETCGGEYVHTMTTAELVEHTHGVGATLGIGTGPDSNSYSGATPSEDVQSTAEGSSEPFNIQQPWYSVYQWIRTA